MPLGPTITFCSGITYDEDFQEEAAEGGIKRGLENVTY
jgi:hypothetical protein